MVEEFPQKIKEIKEIKETEEIEASDKEMLK